MAGYRVSRQSEDIARELTAILRTVKDPRVQNAMLSIVRVDVSNDLSYATVYVSSLNGMEATKEALPGLKSAAGYMRSTLGSSIKLRHVPELRFVADDSIEYSAHISQKLHDIFQDKTKGE